MDDYPNWKLNLGSVQGILEFAVALMCYRPQIVSTDDDVFYDCKLYINCCKFKGLNSCSPRMYSYMLTGIYLDTM